MTTLVDLIDDLAETPEEILDGLPKWVRVLSELCREATDRKELKMGRLESSPTGNYSKSHRPHQNPLLNRNTSLPSTRSLDYLFDVLQEAKKRQRSSIMFSRDWCAVEANCVQ